MAKPAKRKSPARAAEKATRKAARKATSARKAKKAAPRKAGPQRDAKAAQRRLAASVAGRPGTSGKADGDAPVRAYIEGLPGWQRAIAEKLDAILAREVPGVKRAIKWSVPVYGQAGKGWFAYLSPFAKHVGFGFYEGVSLTPPPPEGAGKGSRHVKLTSHADVDEAQVADWVRQAAALPGWGRA